MERTDSDWYLMVTEKRQKQQRKALLEATPAILGWLEVYGIDREQAKDAPLFPAMEANGEMPSRRHITTRQILNIIKKYARSVGIQVERNGRRGIGTHSLRKTALTNALQHSAKMEQVQSLAGHADIRTTQLYYEKGEKDAEDAARHIQIR